MTTFFQSLLSSSSGNCLALWTPTSSILIDCGVSSQRRCRELLEGRRHTAGNVDALIVSHAHGDHVSSSTLRVMEKEGIPVHAHRLVLAQLRDRHGLRDRASKPAFRPFGADAFQAGDFEVRAIAVPHAPGCPNFGFVIRCGWGRGARRIVVCTDLHDYRPILPHLVDADFVFIEANHDLDLLRRHPNPASRYHLNNVKTAWLLHHAARQGASAPRAVMLGHLSEERNTRRIALAEVRRVFERQGTGLDFHLDTAPANQESDVVEIL